MNQAQHEFDQTIQKRRALLAEHLRQPLSEMAASCASVWPNTYALNTALHAALNQCVEQGQHCSLLYVIAPDGSQLSDNHAPNDEITCYVDQSVSIVPFLQEVQGPFGVSNMRISSRNHRSCVSAVHSITVDGETKGYVVADFPLSALPEYEQSPEDRLMWFQMKGDPSIRDTLFLQTRTISAMDDQLDDVLTIFEELILERGVFHAKLHYSSSRATIWLYDDPYRYRLHPLDEILNVACLAYPRKPYPKEAMVSPEEVRKVLRLFKLLREADETIYLRASSINVINGFVALNFSCDGSHYIPVTEFIEKDSAFWFGASDI